ncbi:MAG: class I SAM-dependent methyltransferase [Xanthomonadaceae bacterium]|nr:class I SAM-dependent methyltransferase [Xanthomonadaceae bacterium]
MTDSITASINNSNDAFYPIKFRKSGTLETLPALAVNVKEVHKKEECNHFLWDGEMLKWVDLEAGNLEIDFLSAKLKWRYERINRAQEPLLRALDWHSETPQTLFDLTAGLGRDSLMLLHAGFTVTMFERDPVLQVLLNEAVKRFQAEKPIEANRLTFIAEDAGAYLTRLIEGNVNSNASVPDLIYMDPMYPEREKSALVKKELRIIRNRVGADHDSEILLKKALQTGAKRVVIKRPSHAPFVGEKSPHHSVESPNTRFDVYMNHG